MLNEVKEDEDIPDGGGRVLILTRDRTLHLQLGATNTHTHTHRKAVKWTQWAAAVKHGSISESGIFFLWKELGSDRSNDQTNENLKLSEGSFSLLALKLDVNNDLLTPVMWGCLFCHLSCQNTCVFFLKISTALISSSRPLSLMMITGAWKQSCQCALCSLLSAACSLLNTVSQIITEHFVALKDAINPNNLSVWIRVLLKNEASL